MSGILGLTAQLCNVGPELTPIGVVGTQDWLAVGMFPYGPVTARG